MMMRNTPNFKERVTANLKKVLSLQFQVYKLLQAKPGLVSSVRLKLTCRALQQSDVICFPDEVINKFEDALKTFF